MDSLKKVGDEVVVQRGNEVYEGTVEDVSTIWSTDPRLTFPSNPMALAMVRGFSGAKPIGTRYIVRCKSCSNRFLVEHYGEFIEEVKADEPA